MLAQAADYAPYPRWWRITGAYADGTVMEPHAFATNDPQIAQNALIAQQAIAPNASLEVWTGTRWMPYLVA